MGTKSKILELSARLQTKEISFQSLAQDFIAKASQHESLNAIISLDDAGLMAQAQKLDDAGVDNIDANAVLTGIPFIAKDNINTNNLPTSGGTAALKNNTPPKNAPVIEALLQAGAFCAGKANMHELAFGITSNNANTGAVKNPHHSAKIPGGSSGGSAAAVAAGIVPFALATDTGGSSRIPAALCGVTGFRPTTGRYNGDGVIPISHTRDTVGTIAQNVADIAIIDAVLAGKKYSLADMDLSTIKLGISTSVLCEDLSPEVKACFDAQIKKLAAAGVQFVELDISAIWEHNMAYSFPVVLYEVMKDLPQYLQTYASAIDFDALLAGVKSPDVAGVLQSQLGDDAMPEAAYRAALDVHFPKMTAIYQDAFQQAGISALIFPTTPLEATDIGQDETVELNGNQVPTFPTFIRNTDLGSNLGVPGISIPAYRDKSLPIGIELDGIKNSDEELLSLAKAVEAVISKP